MRSVSPNYSYLTFMRGLMLLSLMLCLAATAAAQRFSIGVEGSAGVVFSYVKTSWRPITDLKPAPGFSAGLTFNYHLRRGRVPVSIKTIVAYEKKMIHFTYNSLWDAKYHYHFTSLPVLADVAFGKKNMFHANGGLFFAYLVKSKGEFENFPDNDRTSFLNRFDMGIVAGIGISKKFEHWLATTFSIRNSLGLAHIERESIIKMNTTSLVVECRIFGPKPKNQLLIVPRF